MEKNLPKQLQEIIFGSSDPSKSRQIAKLEKDGQIRKIAPRIYSANLTETPEVIIRRNLFSVLAHLYPGAVLSHRSALEFEPTQTGQLFLTYKYTRKAKLPGITIRFLEGESAIEGDNPLAGKLFASQLERALLENLQVSRKQGDDSKILPIDIIEEKLEQVVRINGEEALNLLRDKAKKIAAQLGFQKEFKKLDKIVSALLSTRPSKILTSPVAAARAFGVPYDPGRVELFEILFRALQQEEFKDRPDPNMRISAFRNFAFFESYFSNYIEGTIFNIEDAMKIIETRQPIPARDEDSHDVLGTYNIVSNYDEMVITPRSGEELIEILQDRHAELLSARISKKPGQFKDRNNYAGQTQFVDFQLVRGTLIKGFDFYQALRQPFAKAAYMMFIVSEIHPFLDGNGRIARVMMNAELVTTEQARIMIPTVYRDDYLLALRRLTRQREADAYIKMLSRAQEFSATITGNKMEQMQDKLTQSNAFMEQSEGRLRIL